MANDESMSSDEFYAKWTTISARDGSDRMDWSEAWTYPPNQIWTWIEAGDSADHIYLTAGKHLDNAFGFAVTTKPWVTRNEQMILDASDDDVDEKTVNEWLFDNNPNEELR